MQKMVECERLVGSSAVVQDLWQGGRAGEDCGQTWAEGMEWFYSWSPEGMQEKEDTGLVMERWGSCVLLDFMVVERSVLDLIIV